MSWYDIPDHPVIRNMERTGYPDGKEPEYPHCPECREKEIDEIYLQDDDIIGCENCVHTKWFDDEGMPDVCPVCGKPYEVAYTDKAGIVLGCDMCVRRKDAWEDEHCFYGER